MNGPNVCMYKMCVMLCVCHLIYIYIYIYIRLGGYTSRQAYRDYDPTIKSSRWYNPNHPNNPNNPDDYFDHTLSLSLSLS